MPYPYTYNGTLPHGTRALTIGGVYYICNNFNAQKSGNVFRRQTEAGAPNGAVMVEEPGTATMQLQLASTSTSYPQLGVTFATSTHWSSTTTFFIQSVGAPEEQRGFKVVDVNCEEAV